MKKCFHDHDPRRGRLRRAREIAALKRPIALLHPDRDKLALPFPGPAEPVGGWLGAAGSLPYATLTVASGEAGSGLSARLRGSSLRPEDAYRSYWDMAAPVDAR